jgi:hypothetical protein
MTLSRPWFTSLLVALELPVAVGATFALLSPRLSTLGSNWFDSLCLPALVLFPLVGVGGLLTQAPWATAGALTVGLLLLLWSSTQVLLASPIERPLVLAAVAWGALLTTLAWLQRSREVREVRGLRWAVSR